MFSSQEMVGVLVSLSVELVITIVEADECGYSSTAAFETPSCPAHPHTKAAR
jgi:hypothetical protein